LATHSVTWIAIGCEFERVAEIDTVVLLTEYKDLTTYYGQQTLFASIRSRFSKEPGVINVIQQPGDLFKSVETQLFMDAPLDAGGFKLLARQ
jgi:hypothetical protein